MISTIPSDTLNDIFDHMIKNKKTLKIIKSLQKSEKVRYDYTKNPHWRHWGDLFNIQENFLCFTETTDFYAGGIEYKIIRKNTRNDESREYVLSKNFSSPQSKWFTKRQKFISDVLKKKGLYDENVIELILHYVSFFVSNTINKK